jgi:surface antigen
VNADCASGTCTYSFTYNEGSQSPCTASNVGNAIDLFAVARAEGFQLDNRPTPGAMVVYGSTYRVFGHIATVRAVQGDRSEVVEQNFLDFDPNLEPHWAIFDLRSVAWPDPVVVGFVVAPPVG